MIANKYETYRISFLHQLFNSLLIDIGVPILNPIDVFLHITVDYINKIC